MDAFKAKNISVTACKENEKKKLREKMDFIYFIFYLFTIFKQACPVQHGWFKWRPVKNSIIQIN